MTRFLRIVLLTVFSSLILSPLKAQDFDPEPRSYVTSDVDFIDSLPLMKHAPEWTRKYLNSFLRGNIDCTRERRFDLSFGISPSYTREASFGLGALCTGLYRMDRNDTLVNPSDVFICLNASLNGFFVFTLKGNNLFPDNRSRLSYKFEMYRKQLDFWGINSEATAHNPKSRYDRRQVDLQLEYVYRISHNWYLGAHLRSDYTDARNMLDPQYLLGERPQVYVTGLGASIELDSRDNLVTPTRGVHVSYMAMLFPKFLGNAPSFFNSHRFILNAYRRLWRGSILAFDLYAKINSANAPWTMREMVASDGIRMRGYYMGSYIDNSQIATQIELRQNLWRRLGMTAWVGGATVFSALSDFRDKDIKPEWIPNWGLGLRIEFKHNVNARIDFGMGRHTSGFVFAVGEAF